MAAEVATRTRLPRQGKKFAIILSILSCRSPALSITIYPFYNMTLFPFSKSNLPKQLAINNEYVNSKSGKKISVYNPKDGSLIADDVPLAGERDVDDAVAAAEEAFVSALSHS